MFIFAQMFNYQKSIQNRRESMCRGQTPDKLTKSVQGSDLWQAKKFMEVKGIQRFHFPEKNGMMILAEN